MSLDEQTGGDREWLASVRRAESLAELADTLGVASGHEAYLHAKPRWFLRRGRELAADGRDSCVGAERTEVTDGGAVSADVESEEPVPGSCTTVDGVAYHVHGVTHADTAAERDRLRGFTRQVLDRGAAVYSEQGIRGLYFADMDVCAMDDYRWALDRCQGDNIEQHVADLLGDTDWEPSDATEPGPSIRGGDTGESADTDESDWAGEPDEPAHEPDEGDRLTNERTTTPRSSMASGRGKRGTSGAAGVAASVPVGSSRSHTDPFTVDDDLERLRLRFRDTALSLLESDVDDGADGDLRRTLTDVVSAFPPTHEDMAIGRDAASVRLRRRAARDPSRLGELQRYYERAFLPQPLEREWLARHDPELEIVTHARNARMADYAVAHAPDDLDTPASDHDTAVHLFVGAAHGPGVREYLERHRDGRRSLDGFEPV